jgi:hypothetical protein
MILSWLVATNHCAIAQAVGAVVSNCHAPAAGEHCPSHEPPSDTSENGQGQMECCWAVKVSLNPVQSHIVNAASLASPLCEEWLYPEFVGPEFESASLAWHWDHGPPKVRSFAEQVLQRCILSNAPPV